MIRYIDAELLEKSVLKPSMFDINREDVLALIAEIPTADVVPRGDVDILRQRLAEEEQIRKSLEDYMRHGFEKEKKKVILNALEDLRAHIDRLREECEYEKIELLPCTCGGQPSLRIAYDIMVGHGSFDDLIWYECPKCGKEADRAAGQEFKSRIKAIGEWNKMILADKKKAKAIKKESRGKKDGKQA